jgi:hypothetical protein
VLTPRIRAALVVLAASAGLSACTSLGPYGGVSAGIGSPYGYGQYGYDPYYSGYGYGSPYGYAGYGSQYGYGSGYGYDPFGWYNGYYYPGTGYYVYDPDRNRRHITPEEQAYWENRIRQHSFLRGLVGTKSASTGTTTTVVTKENWSGFNRRPGTATATGSATTTGTTSPADVQQRRNVFRQQVLEQQAAQQQLRSERQQAQQQLRSERQQARSERFEARQQASSEQREARRVRRTTPDE